MSVSPSHPHARLADHVRACRIGDQMILLDLRRGRYIGIGGPQLAALSATLLGGRALDDAQAAARPDSAALDAGMRRLRDQHLLSDSPAAGRPVAPEVHEVTATLATEAEDDDAAFEWRPLLRLWRATLVTSGWLRRRSLADIAERVQALKARPSHRRDATAAGALEAATRLYMRLRPFALTTHDRCLNDSLALVHFLATQGLSAQWVIGVRVHPFGAHSWVQSGSVVLNDLAERVRRYQPILVV